MDIAAILARYDEQMRRTASACPGQRVERLPRITRLTDDRPHSHANTILFSRLDAASADAALAEQIAHYQSLGRGFEWKLYGHDQPPDLLARLAARDFHIGEAEALLALDLQSPAASRDESAARSDLELRRVTCPEAMADLVAVQRTVWGDDDAGLGDTLTAELRARPDGLHVYVAYLAGRPVAAAWIRFHPEREFAELWGGSTLPDARHRGIYRALVARRAADARARGARFLTVDASPMSRPILERLGFVYLTSTVPCTFVPPRP